jgi:hypothetical protein
MKRVVLVLLGTLLLSVPCRAQDAATNRMGPADQTESARANWQQLYEKAENVAQQWEAQDKRLEGDIAAQLRAMKSSTREASEKEAKKEALPPAPQPEPRTSQSSAAPDYQKLFWGADSRGKAWRARAVALDARYRTFQERLSGEKIKAAGYSPPRPVTYASANRAHAPNARRTVPVNPKNNGKYAAPYYHITP